MQHKAQKNPSQKNDMSKDLVSIEEFSTHLLDMLSAALYFAGVKKECLDEALNAYEDLLEDSSVDEESEFGLDDIIKIIKDLKLTRKELFI